MEARTNRAKAIVYIVLASAFFGIGPVFVKEALMGGTNVNLSLALRMFVISVVGAVAARSRGSSMRVTKKQLASLAVFGVIGYGLTNLLLSLSYLYVDMGVATMCHFAYPILVTLAMRVLYRENLSPSKLLAAICAVTGLVLLAQDNGIANIKGILIAILSGAAYGIYVIAMDKAVFRTLNSFVVVSYVGGFCCIFFAVLTVCSGKAVTAPSLRVCTFLVIAAVMGSIAMMLLNKGVRAVGASTAAFINMLEPVINLAVDMGVYVAIPSVTGWGGCIMILLSVFLVSVKK